MARPKRPPTPVSSSAPEPARAPWLRLALVVVVAAAVAGVGLWMRTPGAVSSARPAKPNVLLITLDTTRADRIGSYGYAAAATPHLDRLAASGVRFEQALSPAPLTLPAHASLMTGREPYAHGVRNNGYFALSSEVPTLAEAFTAAGYDTAAFVSAFVLDRQFGLARGFAHYDDALDRLADAESSLEIERRGDRTVQAAAAWWSSRPAGRPFFMWVHLFDPHEPYAPPSPFRERFADRGYDGEVAFSDAMVGRLLDQTGARDSTTLVVVAGDHGESLGAHGESTHGLFVYDVALRVPLIMAGAGITAPAVVTDPVRLIDVAPTVADLAGLSFGHPPVARPVRPTSDVENPGSDVGKAGSDVETPRSDVEKPGSDVENPTSDVENAGSDVDRADGAGGAGRSLRPLMNGQRGEDSVPIYAETYFPQFFMGWSPLQSLRVGRWKFIDAPEPELYDLSKDPGELTNLIAREAARAQSLARGLTSTLAAHASKTTPTPMTEEARQRLASLGYVSVAAPAPADPGARGADPKRMVAVFERLLAGNRALATGDAESAARVAREVVAQDPQNAFARLLQGRAALALDRNRDAIAAFTAYLALVPQSADAHHFTALAALRLGDRTRALAEEQAALALDPRHTSALGLRAGLLFSSGRADEALATLRDAIARDPANQTLVLELADLLADAQQFGEAEREYQRVLRTHPSNGRALTGLGLVLTATHRLEAALDPLTKAVSVNPRDEEARLARAEVLAGLGRAAEARAEFEQLALVATRPDIRAAASRGARRATRREP